MTVRLAGRLASLLPLLLVAACTVDESALGEGTPPPGTDRPDARQDRAPSPPPAADAAPAPPPVPPPVAAPGPDAPADAGGMADAGSADAPSAATDGQVGTSSVDANAAPDPGGARPCEPSADLALCLRFEGNLDDQSGNGLRVRSVGPFAFESSPEGQAIDLRRGLQLAIAETPTLDSPVLTIQVTVRPRALGRRMGIVENLGQYTLVILPSGSAMCTGGGAYALTNNAVAPERWTQLSCVYDGTRVMLFIDGRQTATNPTGPLATDRSAGLRIGWEDTPERDFDGLLADLRIWRAVHRP
jgi:hypothetical protein